MFLLFPPSVLKNVMQSWGADVLLEQFVAATTVAAVWVGTHADRDIL